MDEEIKVGDIVYWYSENTSLRRAMFIAFPFLENTYGVVTRKDHLSIIIKYPGRHNSFSSYLTNVYKVEME